jgi:uncharacterized protein (DUF2252 family)
MPTISVSDNDMRVTSLLRRSAGARTDDWPGVRAQQPLTRRARLLRGKAARADLPRREQGVWTPAAHRPDPVETLMEQSKGRLVDLVPVRNGRMLVSPFTFFRGSAAVMAADLAATATTGVRVQLCGDAHLSNFGGYAAPDRALVFDLNDFDETLPGPWEWDVKRLATSLEIAGRDRGFDELERRAVVRAGSAAYRNAMSEFARMPTLHVWYSRLTVADIRDRWGSAAGRNAARKFDRQISKAMTKDSSRASAKLSRLVDGRPRMLSDPPLLVPVSELLEETDLQAFDGIVTDALRSYRRSLPGARRHLLDEFRYADVARKVVGVGSVGTRSWALLLTGLDGEPLLLQLKEAGKSVLAPFAGGSRYNNQGQRVVVGQQLLQASSDVFLGWIRTQALDGVARDFYIRQLWDWKISADVENQSARTMSIYAQMCGWTLARAHARSGDRCAIAGYLGRGDAFDVAMTEFAAAYADQNEADYQQFAQAATDHRFEVHRDL